MIVMYFKDKSNTNIDSEFNNKKIDIKFDIKKMKIPLIILIIVLLCSRILNKLGIVIYRF